MITGREKVFLKDRSDAGRLLAAELARYQGKATVVFAIPQVESR